MMSNPQGRQRFSERQAWRSRVKSSISFSLDRPIAPRLIFEKGALGRCLLCALRGCQGRPDIYGS